MYEPDLYDPRQPHQLAVVGTTLASVSLRLQVVSTCGVLVLPPGVVAVAGQQLVFLMTEFLFVCVCIV